MRGYRAFSKEAKVGKPMKGGGGDDEEAVPSAPRMQLSSSLRKSESGPVNGRRSEAVNWLPLKERWELRNPV